MNNETVSDRQAPLASDGFHQSERATDTTDCRRQRTRRSAHHGGDRVRATSSPSPICSITRCVRGCSQN